MMQAQWRGASLEVEQLGTPTFEFANRLDVDTAEPESWEAA